MHACSFPYITLLLSQSVVLFEVGYHAESMASIADLTDHCPVKVKSACSTAQAGVSNE